MLTQATSYFAEDEEAWFGWAQCHVLAWTADCFKEQDRGCLVFIEAEQLESKASGYYGFIDKERMKSTSSAVVPSILLKNLVRTLSEANIKCTIHVDACGELVLSPNQ